MIQQFETQNESFQFSAQSCSAIGSRLDCRSRGRELDPDSALYFRGN